MSVTSVGAALFDVDGTLVDTVDMHAACWVRAFAQFGVETAFPDVRHQIGKGGDQLMPVFLSPEQIERQGEEIDRFRGALFRREYLPSVRPFPGVRALFEALKAEGVAIVLASSGQHAEIDGYVRLLAVEDLVDAVTTSEDAERSKPFPDIFEAALAKAPGVKPTQAVAVGDTPYDAQAAGRAGVACVGVLSGGFPGEELRAAGCGAVYEDVEQLLHAVRRPGAPAWWDDRRPA